MGSQKSVSDMYVSVSIVLVESILTQFTENVALIAAVNLSVMT